MDRLILFRHGKAERTAPGGDIARRLTDRGRRDAEIMGGVLATQGLVPDLALVSSAARTQETWEAASPAFPGARLLVRRDLYLADEAVIVDLAETLGRSAGTVMIVGHNPGLHMLTLGLLRQGGAGAAVMARAQDKFATSSVSAFTFDAAGRPTYDGLFHASDHGGGASE
ncbi:histidine phosphatase family protein [Caulobacter sp. SLTY]|uniref:SixA phosphatase family protein n=1 Tax=Caulobacter sp. SLTY TaxID=2683262 RepID=UPI0014132E2C|nr:histidine phosphatase family protein [Caulobacter sp. SLTY]NBB16965.1 histidine phosphatase family protein [Caulobacter sp. SLTY]